MEAKMAQYYDNLTNWGSPIAPDAVPSSDPSLLGFYDGNNASKAKKQKFNNEVNAHIQQHRWSLPSPLDSHLSDHGVEESGVDPDLHAELIEIQKENMKLSEAEWNWAINWSKFFFLLCYLIFNDIDISDVEMILI